MESIFAFSCYRVKYSKAWHAKQHVITLLWGDWLESYGRVPRVLTGISLFNPGIRWFTYTGNMMLPHNGAYKRVFVMYHNQGHPNLGTKTPSKVQNAIR